MNITTLRDLLEKELQDLYSAEIQLTMALPKLAGESSDPKLRQALSEHLTVTEEHVVRLKQIMNDWSLSVGKKVCMGIKGIIAEGEALLPEVSDSATRDAAIIASAQKAEHYEIGAYGSAIQFAKHLELDEAAELLSLTLKEEKEADVTLSQLATGGLFSTGINERAADSEVS